MLGKSTLQSAFGHWKGITRAAKEGLEVWAPVGESHYLVSTFGNVKNGKTGELLKGKCSRGYAQVGLYIVPLERTYHGVHRLVAKSFLSNPDSKSQVDHLDNNRSNNHVGNLRYATPSENQMNKSVLKSCKSGVTGVRFHIRDNKWCAQIQINSKQKHLGYFNTKEEAMDARIKASNELFGEFTHSSQKVA